MNKQYLKWEDIEVLVDILYKKIQSDLQPINSIHGLKRGGYIPAVMLSHKLMSFGKEMIVELYKTIKYSLVSPQIVRIFNQIK